MIHKIVWKFAWFVRDWRGAIGHWGTSYIWNNSDDPACSSEMEGVECVDCGDQATHYYSWGPICCECHFAFGEEVDRRQREAYAGPQGPPLDDPKIMSDEDLAILDTEWRQSCDGGTTQL